MHANVREQQLHHGSSRQAARLTADRRNNSCTSRATVASRDQHLHRGTNICTAGPTFAPREQQLHRGTNICTAGATVTPREQQLHRGSNSCTAGAAVALQDEQLFWGNQSWSHFEKTSSLRYNPNCSVTRGKHLTLFLVDSLNCIWIIYAQKLVRGFRTEVFMFLFFQYVPLLYGFVATLTFQVSKPHVKLLHIPLDMFV